MVNHFDISYGQKSHVTPFKHGETLKKLDHMLQTRSNSTPTYFPHECHNTVMPRPLLAVKLTEFDCCLIPMYTCKYVRETDIIL